MGLKISFNPRDIARRFGKAYDYFVHGKADPRQINCLALKKLVIFTREQGGEAHCQVNNLGLPNGVMFDWLDEVLE